LVRYHVCVVLFTRDSNGVESSKFTDRLEDFEGCDASSDFDCGLPKPAKVVPLLFAAFRSKPSPSETVGMWSPCVSVL